MRRLETEHRKISQSSFCHKFARRMEIRRVTSQSYTWVLTVALYKSLPGSVTFQALLLKSLICTNFLKQQ